MKPFDYSEEIRAERVDLGWKIYPIYIEPEDHLVCKTYMTRIEGENTRLRH